MPATKTKLIGGLFQDADGVVLNKGYLLFELSHDSQVTGLITQVCAGVNIKITLNSSGSVDQTVAQYIWGNDDLLPINSFYTVAGYTAAGQLAWGPNHQQVTSGATFDVGTWVPDLLTNWNPPLQSPELDTNGVLNGNQAKLNLKNGKNIAITDAGNGDVTIAGPTFAGGKNITVTGNTSGGAGTVTIAEISTPYDIGIPIVGQPDASESIGYIIPRAVTFLGNFSGSYATSAVASAGTIVFVIKKNNAQVGTVTFTASVTGVFASTSGLPVSFAAADLLELVAPAVVDATWANGRFTIVGSR